MRLTKFVICVRHEILLLHDDIEKHGIETWSLFDYCMRLAKFVMCTIDDIRLCYEANEFRGMCQRRHSIRSRRYRESWHRERFVSWLVDEANQTRDMCQRMKFDDVTTITRNIAYINNCCLITSTSQTVAQNYKVRVMCRGSGKHYWNTRWEFKHQFREFGKCVNNIWNLCILDAYIREFGNVCICLSDVYIMYMLCP